jgi:radical SAM enzyme (TIGR01210 family)
MLLMVFEQYEKPVACWKGKEYYFGEERQCLTVILKSGGCSWGQCRMCGYAHERYPSRDPRFLTDRIRAQLAWVHQHYDPASYEMVKIFTSGSFLDPEEVPFEAQQLVFHAFQGKILLVETRPEHVTETVLTKLRGERECDRSPFYIAMGLETTSDLIREKCIHKGFTLADAIKAAAIAHQAGVGVKMYLLLKPPFLTEQEAIRDMNTSIREVQDCCEILSLNLCTVQARTEVEWYWRRGMYRPPYLWSALQVLVSSPVHVLCDPIGGGTKRGPHNCGICDHEILQGIRTYSLNGDRELARSLLSMECSCKQEWEYVLEREKAFCLPLTR